jgi:glyoxylase-like metal-dependent hydrolase (beta-lactamase superfamily II)
MYKVYAITQGEREVDYSGMLPWVVEGGTMGLIDFYLWCLKGEDTAVLVDTGMTGGHAEEFCTAKCYGGEKYVEDRLKKLGVDPAAVKTVIITHLHGDHFGAYNLYPNATFYIQKRDIEFFTGPGVKFLQVNQFAANMSEVMTLAYAKRIQYLDGDAEIAPGVRAVLIGGHTPGSQAVVVSTSKGNAVICGDSIDLYRTMDDKVNGMAIDLLQALLGVEKIQALASSPELIVPAHDPLVLERFPSSIEGVAEIV